MSVRKIANRLNISPSTVSLALRGDVKISTRTRLAVQAEAERIGYRRDAKLNEMMTHLRHRGLRPAESCFAVLSLTDELRPWEKTQSGRLMYQTMVSRAERLGYRLEAFRLNEVGMSVSRMRKILDTRRIDGMFCFGGQDEGRGFPTELFGGSVVSLGLGFHGMVNSVAPDYFSDILGVLDRLEMAGKKRIALLLGKSVSEAVASRYLGAFLWRRGQQGTNAPLVWNAGAIGGKTVQDWLYQESPDAVIVAGKSEMREGSLLDRICKTDKIEQVSLDLDSRNGSGLIPAAVQMGERAVDMLVRCVTEREVGLPEHPKVELIGSEWVDTESEYLTFGGGASEAPRESVVVAG